MTISYIFPARNVERSEGLAVRKKNKRGGSTGAKKSNWVRLSQIKMPIILLSTILSGGQAHGGETGKQGAHANPEPCVPPLGVHLNTRWEWHTGI